MNKYRAWIPTNNGVLTQELVAASYVPSAVKTTGHILTLTQENTSDYSDSIFDQQLKKELPISYEIKINFEKRPWRFNLIVYVDSQQAIVSDGLIYKNGLVDFNVQINALYGDLANIENTVFTMVKNCVHGNSHHNQKVDTIIPVQKLVLFKYSNIAYNLSNEIKRYEYEAKRLMEENIPLENISQILNLNEKAKGFKSYYDTFCVLFKDKLKEEDENIGNPNSVLYSLESIKNRVDIKVTKSKFTMGVFFSIVAFFISSNILMKTSNNSDFLEKHHFALFVLTIVISAITALIIDVKYIGFIKKILKVSSSFKEKLQRIYLYCVAVKIYKKNVIEERKKYCIFYYLIKYGIYILWILIIIIAFLFYNILQKVSADYKTMDTNKSSILDSKINKIQIEANITNIKAQ
jgi:hypothetical protein